MLQDVRGHEAGVNIVLTNPDILQTSIFISTSSPCSEEDERGEETSQERTSYSSLTSGDSGQLSGSKLSLAVTSKLQGEAEEVEEEGGNSRKASDSGVGSHSPSPDLASDGEEAPRNKSEEESGAHKITVYVKYTGDGSGSPLVEGSVDSEEEERDDGGVGGVQEVGGEGGEDFITICDT